jgi:NTE family protein
MESFGSDYDYEQIYMDFEKPISFDSQNLTFYLEYGNTYKSDAMAMAGTFTLGGLFNLSGYPPYSLNDENMMFGILKYRYQLKDGGFFGSLNAPLYAGFSMEIGDAWGEDYSVTYDKTKKSATIYVAADTFLGPFYLAYGATADGEQSAYLYLGEKF